MGLSRSAGQKTREIVEIFIASRLCPNKSRKLGLHHLGWQVGAGSVIRWGIIPVARRVTIGTDCMIGVGAFFDGGGTIGIEDNVRIGAFLRILSTTHPIEDAVPRRIFGRDCNLDTRIGYGCWLGAQVTILPGVTIARGCVIGAGSIVTRDTVAHGVYAGKPARRIRDLPAG